MFNSFSLLIQRELLGHWRNPQSILQPILFFALTLCLFPIALGADNASLQQISPAALWIVLLLSTLLGAEKIFRLDYETGILAQDRLHFSELWLTVLSKIIAAWLQFILPLLLILPILALLLHLSYHHLPIIALLLTMGSFCLLLIGTMGAALTLSGTQSTFLLFLIVVPFYIPTLIIGVTATHDALIGLSIQAQIALLGAILFFSLITVLPFSALAIRNQSL